MSTREERLSLIAEAVADGRSTDWATAVSSAGDDVERDAIEWLRAVSEIGGAHARSAALVSLGGIFGSAAGHDSGAREEPLANGSSWGPLKVLELVGRGRFGDVYRAWDPRLEREVALKILRRRQDESDTGSQVIGEGRLMARVRHPNVAPIYGAERIDGRTGLWMEFVAGRTLEAELQERGSFPTDDLIRVGVELCRALAAVHAAGLVHRDVKAQNVLRARDGRIVLGDFGTGRELDDSDWDRTGIAGTPACLAPEIFRRQPATPQSDLYSLGALLFHLATAGYPVEGASLREIREGHARGTRASLRARRPDLPKRLVAAVDRALDPDPARRFESAHALEFTLTPAAVPRRRLSPPALAIAGLGLVAAIVLVAIMFQRTAQLVDVGRHSAISSKAGLEIDPSVSPDGKFVAYSAGVPGQMQVLVHEIATGRTWPLIDNPSEDQRRPRWSPAGHRIMFTAGNTIRIVPASGGRASAVIQHSSLVRSAAWSRSGDHIYFIADASLYRVAAAGGIPQALRPVAPDSVGLALSADDSRIAYDAGNQDFSIGTTQFANSAPSVIQVSSVEAGPARDVTRPTSISTSAVWSADGRWLLYVSDREGHRDVYAAEVTRQGTLVQERRITTGLGVHSISLGRDGRTLAYSKLTRRANVWSVNIPAKGVATIADVVQLTRGSQTIEGYLVSPDGRWLYFDSNQHGNADLFRMPIAGGSPERLTSDPADEFTNDVSPDGTQLTFHTFRNARREVFVMPAAGGPSTFVAPGLGTRWSPDGSRLLVADKVILEPGTTHRVLQRVTGGRWETVATFNNELCGGIAWDKGGRGLIAFCGGRLTRRALDGAILETVYAARDGYDPRPASFAVSGDDVYFKSYDSDGSTAFWRVSRPGTSPRLILRLENNQSRRANRMAFGTDGRRLYFTLEELESDIWMTVIGTERR